MKHLILGGARSGKSALAEKMAQILDKPVTYVATAQALDDEMAGRIARHRQVRPAHWHTVETPLRLAETLRHHARAGHCLLVDCLTLWMGNLTLHPDETVLEQERRAFLDCLAELPGDLLLVSNETGMGVIPMGALTRRFVDELGLLHQQTALLCHRVTLVVAGLPLTLKEGAVP